MFEFLFEFVLDMFLDPLFWVEWMNNRRDKRNANAALEASKGLGTS